VSERMYRDQANRLRDEIAKLEKRRADEAGRLARLRQEIGRIKNSITKSTSASTLRSKEGQIAGKERQGADLEKKIAGYASDLATKHRQLTKADENANKAAEQARKKQERTDKDRRTTEVAHARQLTREAERQARAHVWQPAVTLQYPLPQKLKVLVLAANPLDQDQLRLDEEVRAITEKIRMSKYRDRVELISAWAVRTTDLFQALNEHEPHVVHFSGHGSANDEIVFQDELGNSKFVSKAALTELIAATGGHIRLIVFNTASRGTRPRRWSSMWRQPSGSALRSGTTRPGSSPPPSMVRSASDCRWNWRSSRGLPNSRSRASPTISGPSCSLDRGWTPPRWCSCRPRRLG
jgi:ribosomal protein S25